LKRTPPARRADVKLAPRLDEAGDEFLERREAGLMDVVRVARLGRARIFDVQKHDDFFLAGDGCIRYHERDRRAVGVIFGSSQTDHEFSGHDILLTFLRVVDEMRA
jgi:hypothetical protein